MTRLQQAYDEMTPEERAKMAMKISSDYKEEIPAHNITYFFPEAENLASISIDSYAGPSPIGTTISIRNWEATKNDPDYDFSERHRWVIVDVIELIRVEGRYKNRLLNPHVRSFEVCLERRTN